MLTLERSLQQEIMLRIEWERWPVIAIPIPNGLWIPASTETEKRMVRRIIARMKADGMLLTGAPDLALLWAAGKACVECKRPATSNLFGRQPAGRSSPEQKEFAVRCAVLGVTYAIVHSWEELLGCFAAWDVVRP